MYKLIYLTSLLALLGEGLICSAQDTNTMIVDWGDDTFDQLHLSFQDIHVTAISTGYEHTLAIIDSVEVIAWGDNSYGQTTVPAGIIAPIKVSAGLGHSVVLQADGTVVAWGFNDFGQTEVSSFSDIIDIGAGDEHTLLLKSDKTVILVGAGTRYDLSPPAGLVNVEKIAVGNFHNLALKSDQTVVAWGANEFGQSTVPGSIANVQDIGAGQFHSLVLNIDGTVSGWGDNTLFDQLDIPAMGFVDEISVGDYHNLARTGPSTLVAWGSNRFAEGLIPAVLDGRTISYFTAGFAHNTVIVENNRPTSINIADTIYVSENEREPTELSQLLTEDPDVVDTHIYELVSGEGDDDNGQFDIFSFIQKSPISDDLIWTDDYGTDLLRASVSFDYEEGDIYSLRLKSTDLGGLSIEKKVVVRITNVNEEPAGLMLSHDTVGENRPIGTYVGTFSTDDIDIDDTHTYTLVSGNGATDNASFTISDDQLFTNEVFLANDQNTYQIRVRSTDSGGLWVEERFVIHIIQTNRTPIDIMISRDTLPDDMELGSWVGFLSTTDPDPEDSHVYTLVTGAGDADNSSFSIVSNSLLTNTTLDSLTQSLHNIRIRSTDNGKPENLFYEEAFQIVITSADDPPSIEEQFFSIMETEPTGTQIGFIEAKDDGNVVFSILDGNINNTFSLSTKTGLLSLNDASQLDALVRPQYQLTVEVTDDKSQSAQGVVHIEVIHVPAPPEVNDQTYEIKETDSIGTVVGDFTAISPRNNPLIFQIISGNSQGVFGIDEGGVISINDNTTLDAMQTAQYVLRIEVLDTLQMLSAEANAIVEVLEVNETPTGLLLSHDTVSENRPVGTLVGTFSTDDPDSKDTHSYSLVSGIGSLDNASFAISGDQLFTNEVFLANDQNIYQIRVRSTDNGGLWIEERFVIYVIQANSAPTDIWISRDTIPDDLVSGSLVGFFSTTDPDPEDSHSYSIVSGAGDIDNSSFSIVSNSLLTNTPLDSLVQSAYSIRVRSTDNGKPENLYYEKVFQIVILSADRPPIIEEQFFSVEETASNGTQLGVVEAQDEDELVFSVLGGNTGNAFNVHPKTGVLTLNDASQLDAIATPKYELSVGVTDIKGQSAQGVVHVEVIYVPTPPEVADQTFEISETDVVGAHVGQFVAVSPKGYPLSYQILGGNTQDVFEIDGTGMLTIKNNSTLDARRTPHYTLRIEVVDEVQRLSAEADAVVKVLDVNAAPENILLDNHTIDEAQPEGTRVGFLSTVDPDFGDTHTYTMVDGEGDVDNADFVISGNELRSSEIFEARIQSNYTIRVRSQDDGTPSEYLEKVFLIVVNPLELPEIPSAITPNGDGENDYWIIPNLDAYPFNEVVVYDRSGQTVFRSKGYQRPWDGTYQGHHVPVASYYYIIKLNNSLNTKYTGTITVLR
jgi:gliding motility-associated-like protein